MEYTIQQIAAIVGASSSVDGWQDGIISQLLIDSRNLATSSGALFIALQGPHRDGHQFIGEAYEAGVRYFLISQLPSGNRDDAHFLLVRDTLIALQQLAAATRADFSGTVVGITGSNGKTVVKEWLYQVLHDRQRIIRSPRSYNSQVGVPLSIWPLQLSHELAIFEAGISQPGEMDKLAAMIAPTIGVFTSLGAAHDSGFSDRKEKLLEKWKLFKGCNKIVYPQAVADQFFSASDKDQWLPAEEGRFDWGYRKGAKLLIRSVTKEPLRTRMLFRYADKEQELIVPFTDDASLDNVCSVCAACLSLNFALNEIADRIASLAPLQMRLELKNGIQDCRVINDSYSADLHSLPIALRFMNQRANDRKQTVILSDFLETGLPPEELYAEVAALLVSHGIDRLIAIGEDAGQWLRQSLKKVAIDQAYFADSHQFLAQFSQTRFRDEIILVKGARRFAFEEIVAQLEQKIHETVLEINLGAISRNLNAHRLALPIGTRMMAMVKAFAYGSGNTEVASVLQYQKVDYLGVAYTDEGVELRKAGIQLPILVLNTETSSFENLTHYRLEPVLFSFKLLQDFTAHLQRQGLAKYPVHLEVETGMNRLGFTVAELDRVAEWIAPRDTLFLRSVFSHLVGSDDPGLDALTQLQRARLEVAATKMRAAGLHDFWLHLANTAAVQRMPELALDMVRLGIGLYGLGKLPGANLETAVRFRSTIAQLHWLQPGDTVSYNQSGRVDRPSCIATVRLGYGDGYGRALGNGRGKMLIREQLAPTIGNVCMDMTMLDVTDIPAVKEGDEVLVFGPELPVTEIANWAGTIPYEIMTGISQRVKRIYYDE